MHTITIDKKKSVAVNDDRIGLFFEDINYNLDGGLNAEMIENCNFEAMRATGKWNDYHTEFDGLYGWSVWPKTSEKAESGKAIKGATSISIETERPQNSVNIHYLRADVKHAGEGFTNQAYEGIYMEEGIEYIVSFFARSESFDEDIQISVYDGDEVVAYSDTFIIDDGSWSQYFVSLFASRPVERGTFVITLSRPAVVDFDCISMMPENAVCGVFRKDLAEWLKGIKPGFLRFPGGCIIEGNTIENRYQWKKSIGPRENRRFNWNRWAVHNANEENGFCSPFCHYGQTLAVGYYEYFLLCEYLGAKPLPVLNVGLACQYQSTEQVPMDSEAFEAYIQDALDLIEFANGPAESGWGKKRAAMGHPEPFHLELLGIGNEQWQTETVDFFGRYERFEKAIHEQYPDIKLIGSAGPDVLTPRYEAAWKWVREKVAENPSFVHAVDEHYYVRPQWLYDHVDFYDDYPRAAKVFAGEYAAHIEGLWEVQPPEGNTFEAALAEAAFLTGVERNADVVIMASYAPLMARIGYAQWWPNMIWFDGKRSYGTPSYYVQKLYSLYTGDRSFAVKTEGDGLYASATATDETLIVKVVNHSEEDVEVKLDAEPALSEQAQRILLQADLGAFNSVETPEAVVPKTEQVTIKENVLPVPKNSFCVFVFERK